MVEFQQILNGIDGNAGKLPSIIVNHLYCLLFSACFGHVRAMFRINHVAHLLGIKSIPINRVPEGALILADQSQTKVLRALRAGWLRF